MQIKLTLNLGIEEKVDVRDLIARGDIERKAPRAMRSHPEPSWEHVLSLLDLPAQRRRTRSHNVLLWTEALEIQQRVRGSIEDRYPADPAELEREMRRHEASDKAVARRAAELDGWRTGARPSN